MVHGYQIYEDIWDATVGEESHVKESPISLDIAAPFPFANRLFSTLFTPALDKTMEDDGTFVGREPVGTGSFGSLSTLLK